MPMRGGEIRWQRDRSTRCALLAADYEQGIELGRGAGRSDAHGGTRNTWKIMVRNRRGMSLEQKVIKRLQGPIMRYFGDATPSSRSGIEMIDQKASRGNEGSDR